MNPNCLKSGHTSAKCWVKGGGAEGKAPEWFKEMKEKQQCEKGHITTEQDDNHSTRSESEAIFIHEEKQDTLRKEHSSHKETCYKLWPAIYDPGYLLHRMEQQNHPPIKFRCTRVPAHCR